MGAAGGFASGFHYTISLNTPSLAQHKNRAHTSIPEPKHHSTAASTLSSYLLAASLARAPSMPMLKSRSYVSLFAILSSMTAVAERADSRVRCGLDEGKE